MDTTLDDIIKETRSDVYRLMELKKLIDDENSNKFFTEAKNKFILGVRNDYVHHNPEAERTDLAVIDWALQNVESVEIENEMFSAAWTRSDGTIISLEAPIVYDCGDWIAVGVFEMETNEEPKRFKCPHIESWVNYLIQQNS